MSTIGDNPFSRGRVQLESGKVRAMDDSGFSRAGKLAAGAAVSAVVVAGVALGLNALRPWESDKKTAAPATLPGYDNDSVTIGIGEASDRVSRPDQFVLLETDNNVALVNHLRQKQTELEGLDESTNDNVVERGELAGELFSSLAIAQGRLAEEADIFEADGETVKPAFAEQYNSLTDEISEYGVISAVGKIAKILPDAGITTESFVEAAMANNVDFLAGLRQELMSAEDSNDKQAALEAVQTVLVNSAAELLNTTPEKLTAEAGLLNVDIVQLYNFKNDHAISADAFTSDAEQQSRDGGAMNIDPNTGEMECSEAVAECVFIEGTSLEDAVLNTKMMAAYNPLTAAQLASWFGHPDIRNINGNALYDGAEEENALAAKLRQDPEAYRQLLNWLTQEIGAALEEGRLNLVELQNLRITTAMNSDGINLQVNNVFNGGTGLQLTLRDGTVVDVVFRGECCQLTIAGQIKPHVAPVQSKSKSTQASRQNVVYHGGGSNGNGNGGGNTPKNEAANPNNNPSIPGQARESGGTATAEDTSGDDSQARQDGNPGDTAVTGEDGAAEPAAPAGEGAGQIE